MFFIQDITIDSKQKHTFILPNGKNVEMHMEFKPLQNGWFLGFKYLDFEVKSLRIVTSPNMVHQFKNLIPFGVGCFVDENDEPTFQEDFSTGRAKLYVLTSAEVEQFEEFLGG